MSKRLKRLISKTVSFFVRPFFIALGFYLSFFLNNLNHFNNLKITVTVKPRDLNPSLLGLNKLLFDLTVSVKEL